MLTGLVIQFVFSDPTGMIEYDQDGLASVSTDLSGNSRGQAFINRKSLEAKTKTVKIQNEQASNSNTPTPSLKKAFGKALESLADARVEDILIQLDGSLDTYGPFLAYEEVDGYTYKSSIIGDNNYSFKNVKLSVFGQEVTVDELIFSVSPNGFNVVTGSLEFALAGVAGTHFSTDGPTYTIVGKIAKSSIKINSYARINSGSARGRIRKGYIVTKGKNFERIEQILYNRVETQVLDFVNQKYKSPERRQAVVNWLVGQKISKTTNKEKMKLENILFFTLVLLYNSCDSQSTPNNKYDRYNTTMLMDFPFLTCEFYIEKNYFPNSKKDFESFLDDRIDGEGLKSIVGDMNYGFLINEETQTIDIYDWGWDNDDDQLKTSYTLDTLYPKRDGDLLLFNMPIYDCEKRKRKDESIINYFSKGELVEKKIRLNHSKVVEDFIHKSVIKDYGPEDIYVPKNTKDFRKLSILHYKLEDGRTWKPNLLKSEHQENFSQLIPVITNFLNNSDTLKKHEIDEIILPISYYEMNQLEKL